MNKSLLSKLMAREDLKVIEGNFKTASFDPKNRILKLPIIKEQYNEASILFIGHEIGHALYTPDFFSHNEKSEFGDIGDIPFPIINIVEDVRIERKVREFYPGLVNDFIKGYKKLMDDDFFGINSCDANKLKFLDRLNLKAKLSNSINLNFSLAESIMMKKVFEIETFEDTISVSRELMEFIKNEDEEKEDSGESEEDSDQPDEDSGETEESEETKDSEEKGEPDDESEPEEDDSEIEESDEDKLFESLTDNAFRKNEDKLIFSSNVSHIKFTRKQLKEEFLCTDDDLNKSKEIAMNGEFHKGEYSELLEKYSIEYKEFVRDVKPSVNAMVQQFELRKAAIESKKIRESVSGTIDVNKLWKYKLDDRIFKSVMSVPNGKNHGLIMYVDFSASMSNRLLETVKQSIILSMFAKRVGIPFELYTFTTNWIKYNQRWHDPDEPKYDIADWALSVVKIADSRWKNSKINEMFERVMFSATLTNANRYEGDWWRYRWAIEPAFKLGGTPLGELSAVSLMMVDDFVKRNNTEKMNVIFLTDGEAQPFKITDEPIPPHNSKSKSLIVSVEGHDNFELNNINEGSRYFVDYTLAIKTKIFERLSKRYNVVGFFLTAYRTDVDKKTGFRVYDNKDGYDKFIMVHDKKLKSISDEFITKADSDSDTILTDKRRMNSIKSDFKKFQKKKKSNKFIAEEFARIVA